VAGLVLCATILFGMAFAALYGMGGKELSATIFFITFYGVLRLYIPPWDETVNSLFLSHRMKAKVFAIDHFILNEKQEISISAWCPICLHNWASGDELAMGRVCGHVFHRDCLKMWLSRNTSCPCCRRDMEASEADWAAGRVEKSTPSVNPFGSSEASTSS
jgi:Ring finger domain